MELNCIEFNFMEFKYSEFVGWDYLEFIKPRMCVTRNPCRKAKAASPITYVSKDSPPFLIMHGDKDTTVPLGQSELLRDALQGVGVEAHLEVIPDAGHAFGGTELLQHVESFFDQHLKSQRPQR